MREGKKILILKEKHGNLYVDVSTEKKWASALLHIVKDRHSQGWYDEVEKAAPPEKFKEYTPEQISLMPKFIVEAIHTNNQHYDVELRIFNRLKQQKKYLEKALGGNPNSAWKLLSCRDDYEYEGVELDTLEDYSGEK